MANSLVAQFQAAIAGIYGAILPIAQNLFIFLAAIHITWALIWWVIEKDDPRGPRHTVHGTGADGTTPVGSAGRFTDTGRYLIITAYEVTDE